MNSKNTCHFSSKKINYYCCLKTFLKTDPTDCHIYMYNTVVHVQIRLQARNTELINLVLGVITNTEAPIHGNVEDNHWLLGKLWGYPELAQNDEVISQIFWLVWGHVCLDTSMLHTWKFKHLISTCIETSHSRQAGLYLHWNKS